ncbi:MAG: bifunctional oligoribonuclease/PAP phosphatase NrnA [Bacilli bacterium]|nr:bifunctional oligoribonuclease/PAP phosphatase NrnA [Bacilli bacterium]
MSIYKKIYSEIKKAKKIVLARHIGPDPDALGSTLGLKEIILNTFPKKEVYVVGAPASKFRFLGTLDKFESHMQDGLLIVMDTPNIKRIDIPDIKNFEKIIKIDHHPFIDKYGTLEWIDDSSSSTCEMIMDLVSNTKLKMNSKAASILYAGLVSDTDRFMFKTASSKTFLAVSELLEEYDVDITKVYDNLYMRPYKEIKFQGYLAQNFKITPNKVGYIIISEDILNEYNVDVATPGNMINNFNYVEQMLVWTTITFDKDANCFRISIRSRGPVINEVAAKYGGGGHQRASGVRLENVEDIKKLIMDLDLVSADYMQKK